MPVLSRKMSRLGTETAFEVLARADALARQGRDVINLGIGQPDFKTPEHVVEAAVRALRDGHHGYTPAPGILELREAVAADIAARRSVEVDPARIVVVPAARSPCSSRSRCSARRGRRSSIRPRFPHLRVGHRMERRACGAMPLLEDRDFSFDARAVLDLVTTAHPPHHPQLAGQPYRGDGAPGGDRASGGRVARTPPRRGPERRDLLAHDLRRARARVAARLPRDRGPSQSCSTAGARPSP